QRTVCTTPTVFLFFFFQRRSGNTSLVSDWISDVCSSDLAVGRRQHPTGILWRPGSACCRRPPARSALRLAKRVPSEPGPGTSRRSEERRVGKECRSGGSPCH